MAQANVLSVEFSAAELQSIQSAISVLQSTLLPKLKTLSAQDKQQLPKMGDKSVAFVQKAYEYGQLHPTLNPAWLDTEAFRVDLEALKTLQALDRSLTPVVAALSDSQDLAGSEAYQAALLFYANVKGAAKLSLAGAQQVADDLAARFPGTVNAAKAAKV